MTGEPGGRQVSDEKRAREIAKRLLRAHGTGFDWGSAMDEANRNCVPFPLVERAIRTARIEVVWSD